MSEYPRQLGRFTFQDSLGVDSQRALDAMQERLREKQYDIGNAKYVMSLPGGEGDFEGEDDGEMMNIYRNNNGQRELVASVPAGRYKIEADENGAHLFLIPEDEPHRAPLGEEPLSTFENRDAMPGMLAAHNEKMADHYANGPVPAEHRTHRQVAGIPDDATQRAVLRHINTRHHQVFGDTQTKPQAQPRDLTKRLGDADSARGLAELNKANAKFYGSNK
jgi:hypothetical protein